MRGFLSAVLLLFLGGTASAADFASSVIGMSNEVDPDGRVAFTLKYRTYLPATDAMALRKEADEYWQYIYPEVVRSRDVRAHLIAVGHVAGESQDRTIDFVFNRRGYGVWHTQEPEDRTKIDEAFVRDFFDRYDTDGKRKLTSALLLYVAPEWVQKTSSESKDLPITRDFGRDELWASLEALNFATNNFKHERKILAVVLGDDGKSARVDSRQTESGDILGKSEKLVSRTSDFLELRGRFVLITKTVRVIEKYYKWRDDE